MPAATAVDSTLRLPRILCLHGGGTNGRIFKMQMRSFLMNQELTARFRFVFVDAPYESEAGPGILPVYEDCGPFLRWVRWLPQHGKIGDEISRAEVLRVCQSAMNNDDRVGATGEWVGTLGFSQGAKVAVSLLYEMQIGEDEGSPGLLVDKMGRKVTWQFGVVFAGRAPLIALSDSTTRLEWCQTAGGLPEEADMDAIQERPEMKLRVPTVHVHGLKDEGLSLHRRLREDCCAPGTTRLVEWDGTHRLPLKKVDVEPVVEAILEVADEYSLFT